MKVLAIIDVAADVKLEHLVSRLEEELRSSWRLFAADVLREAYVTQMPTRVVFVLEADDIRRAEEQLRTLPLVAEGLLKPELVELRPFLNWSKLFRPDPAQTGSAGLKGQR